MGDDTFNYANLVRKLHPRGRLCGKWRAIRVSQWFYTLDLCKTCLEKECACLRKLGAIHIMSSQMFGIFHTLPLSPFFQKYCRECKQHLKGSHETPPLRANIIGEWAPDWRQIRDIRRHCRDQAIAWVVKMHEGWAATKNFCLDNHHTGLEPSVGMQYEYGNIIFIITIGLVHFFHWHN